MQQERKPIHFDALFSELERNDGRFHVLSDIAATGRGYYDSYQRGKSRVRAMQGASIKKEGETMMIWVFKMVFKIIGYVFIYSFAFVIALMLLPFYGIYVLCGGKRPKQKKKKKEDDSWDFWRGYVELIEGFFDD